MLFCEEALFFPMAFELDFFFASFELCALLPLSETVAPSVFIPLSVFRPCSDFWLEGEAVLNLIIESGSLAEVSLAGLMILLTATDGKDARIAVGSTTESLDLLLLAVRLFAASITVGRSTLLVAFANTDSISLRIVHRLICWHSDLCRLICQVVLVVAFFCRLCRRRRGGRGRRRG